MKGIFQPVLEKWEMATLDPCLCVEEQPGVNSGRSLSMGCELFNWTQSSLLLFSTPKRCFHLLSLFVDWCFSDFTL